MSGNRRSGKKTNILLTLVCILLLVLFGAIMASNYKSEEEETQRLTELAGDQQKGIDNYENVKEHAAQLEEEDKGSTDEEANTSDDKNADNKSTDSTASDDQSSDDSDQADSTENQEIQQETTGVVCWGDDLINGDASATYSYMVVLQKLLTENGYDFNVINKTLQGGGTLSMMKMAGVSDEVLQGYITEHQQAVNGAQLNITETGIRDLTEEQTTRNDLECIPVICMGYYGGWNHDPSELAEQQENILNTFPNKDKFIVVGTRPLDGSVTDAALDEVLSQKWGEHYISLSSVTSQPSATYEAQQLMAEAILQKMEELGYISKD